MDAGEAEGSMNLLGLEPLFKCFDLLKALLKYQW